MGKFYVVEVTTVSGQTAQALWAHDTIESAKSQYHQILASAYANSNLSYALVMLINDHGFTEVMETIGTEETND